MIDDPKVGKSLQVISGTSSIAYLVDIDNQTNQVPDASYWNHTAYLLVNWTSGIKQVRTGEADYPQS